MPKNHKAKIYNRASFYKARLLGPCSFHYLRLRKHQIDEPPYVKLHEFRENEKVETTGGKGRRPPAPISVWSMCLPSVTKSSRTRRKEC